MKDKLDIQWVLIILIGLFFLFKIGASFFGEESSDSYNFEQKEISETTFLFKQTVDYPEIQLSFNDPFLKGSRKTMKEFNSQETINLNQNILPKVNKPIQIKTTPKKVKPNIQFKGFVKNANGSNSGLIYRKGKRFYVDKGDIIDSLSIIMIDDEILKVKVRDSVYNYHIE